MRVRLHCETEDEAWALETGERTIFLDLGAPGGLSRESLATSTLTGVPAYLRLDCGADGLWRAQASPEAPEVFINGELLTHPRLLQSGDFLHAEQWSADFTVEFPPPVLQGDTFTEVPLSKLQKLTIGRQEAASEAKENHIGLDPELTQISRQHVLIEQREGRFMARDTSRTGAALNGQRFDERALVVGDRMVIGPYSFEFTGHSLRAVAARIGAEIKASEVGVDAGGRTILDHVSLRIPACSFVGILGGSGQGKSTLMTAICGMRKPTRGQVTIDGKEPGGEADIGYVPQDDIVHVELTVEQAIRHSAKLRLDARIPPAETSALVDKVIERLGLEEHRHKRINRLSGGQRKRVSVATELLAKPSALFLDEPSSGLDPATEYHLMRLLRHLAATDCTVVCTTHVLGRAYLFDLLLFIHGGRLVFEGTPEEALQFFQVESLDLVYIKLDGSPETTEELEARFQEWRATRNHKLQPPPPPSEDSPKATSNRNPPVRRGALLTQLARLRDIMASDRLALIYLLAQPILIALLIGWVAEDYVLRLFLCLVAVLWFGCSNGAQQIVKERPVFTREKICGVGVNPYLLSKYFLHSAVTGAQGLLLFLVAQTTAAFVHPPSLSPGTMLEEMNRLERDRGEITARAGGEAVLFAAVEEGQATPPPISAVTVPEKAQRISAVRGAAALIAWFSGAGDNVTEASRLDGTGFWPTWFAVIGLKLAALIGTAVVGVAMGLAISGLVQTGTQAVLWVPLILIPQILLGGVVLVRPELSASARTLASLTPSFSAQRILDVSNVYGLPVPLLSNRTKLPVFLTLGEKERVEWTLGGRNYVQAYDQASPVNRSWQNLLVIPFATGQHVAEYSEVITRENSRRRILHDSTEVRNDVFYRKGTVYENLRPAARAGAVLSTWIILSYLLTLWSVRRATTVGA
jgi:ABC-type multidrug transport system ATPase subunit